MSVRKYESTFLTIGLIVSLIGSLFMVYLFIWHQKDVSSDLALDTNAVGNYGSFVGGVVGTILSILLLYLTFRLQREDSENNSRVYENQILNDEFFHLLELYKDIAEKFEYFDSKKSIYNKGKDALKSYLEQMYANYDETVQFNRRRKVAQFEYMDVMHSHYETAAVYYRTIYRIFQIIDEAECEEKKKVEYAKIMRAQLTSAELVMLRYNAMTLYGLKSKQYLNSYNVLKHIQPFDLLELKKWKQKLNAQEVSLANMTMQNLRFLAKGLLTGQSNRLFEQMQDSRYKMYLETNEIHSKFTVKITINNEFVAPKYSQLLWLDNYSNDELEDLLNYFLFDTFCISNFNMFNRRNDLHFQHNVQNYPKRFSTITVSVENKTSKPLKLSN